METLKRFAISLVRSVLILTIALLAVAAVVWGVFELRSSLRDRRNASLTVAKEWRVFTVPTFDNASFHLKTAWREGSIYYLFNIEGYPRAVGLARSEGPGPAFIINFLDKDGFKISERRVPISDFTDMIDTSGQAKGLSWRGDELAEAALYRRMESWELGWAGLSTTASENPFSALAPKPRPAAEGAPRSPKWKSRSSWRLLSRGMTEAAVRGLLGEASNITRDNYSSTWQYGNLLDGGSLHFDNDGTLMTWSEPQF